MQYILAGLYGLIIGNYLTSAYFRIPRFISINGFNEKIGKKPHCSSCNHQLEFYEYFPILNWIFVGFNCNYCKVAINPMYTVIEISMTLISVILFYFLSMTPIYVLSVLLLSSALLNIALFVSYRKFYYKAVTIFLLMSLVTALSYLICYR